VKGYSRHFRRAPASSALPPAMSISVCAAHDYPSRAVTTAGLLAVGKTAETNGAVPLRWPTLVRPAPCDLAASPAAAVYAPAH
jgi:hypothetical protein